MSNKNHSGENKNLIFLTALANQLFKNDRVSFGVEYQAFNNGERERGYYLMQSFEDEEFQPSPPRGRDRASYAWQKYVEGEHIGVSANEAISQLCSIARMELDDNERSLESRRRDWLVARKSLATLQAQYDQGSLPERWVIVRGELPYWGGNARGILYGDDALPYDFVCEEKGVTPNKVYATQSEAAADCALMNVDEEEDYLYVVRRWYPGAVREDEQITGSEPMLSQKEHGK